MENAVNALRIAGGVLIAMIVVGLIVVGVNRLGSYRKVEQDALTNEELEKFNRSFLSYDTDVLTGYKIISLANMAYDTNQRYREVDNYKQVRIFVSFINTDNTDTSGDGATKEKIYLGYDFISTVSGQSATDPAKPKGNQIGVGNNKQYYNMVGYVNNGKGPYYDLGSDKIRKKFRDKYFTCISTQYDDSSETASGRIIQMVFDEIKKAGT